MKEVEKIAQAVVQWLQEAHGVVLTIEAEEYVFSPPLGLNLSYGNNDICCQFFPEHVHARTRTYFLSEQVMYCNPCFLEELMIIVNKAIEFRRMYNAYNDASMARMCRGAD